MAAKRGLNQRMQNAIRKRQHQPRPSAVPTGNVRSDRRDEITASHPKLLLAVETAILEAWAEASGVDDRWVHLGLVGAMRGDLPDHPCSALVFSKLGKLRDEHFDIDDELWRDALRVIDQSVRNRSSLRHGERSYLSYAAAFLAEALDVDPGYKIIQGRIRRPEPPELG